ncbi:MAG: replicative DNA helicase [Chloroflexi bacterium]|nr:replicative DNA helicase [Chloroflexota bacterium]MBI3340756.1 replicative DNA helicase [Chloroflexota bacterium]
MPDPMLTPTAIPHSREAEEAAIGSVLINPNAFHDVRVILPAEDFYIDRHKFIWQAFDALVEKQQPIDLLTVTDELDRMGRLAEIGGAAYLTSLINQAPTSINAEAYAAIVQEQAVRRRMIQAANRVATLAYSSDIPVEEAVEQSWNELEKATASRDNEVHEIGQIMAEAFDRVSELAQLSPEERHGIDTGLRDLDKLLRIRPKNLITIAGRPGMGKTGLALTIALHNAIKRGNNVAIIELEMDKDELADRLASQHAGINLKHIIDATLTEDEWPRYTSTIETTSNARIFINDNADLTLPQMRSWCQKLCNRYGLDLIILDYLGLMEGVGETRERQVAYISRGLKKMAKALGVPVIALHQMNRAIEQRNDGVPILSDLRDSGSIEQDSDAVLFLYTTEEPVGGAARQLVNVSLAKQRNGPKGKLELAFLPAVTKFENV